MITEYSLPNLTWLDVQQPTSDELNILRDKYHLGFEIAKDLSEPISDTRLINHNNQIYFSFHLVSTLALDNEPDWLEIDIIIIDKTIVTVIYDNLQAITSLRQELEIEETLNHKVSTTQEEFLTGIIIKLHKNLRILLAAVNSHQRNIDRKIFSGQERKMVRTISETGRILFNLNQTIAEQSHVIKFLPGLLPIGNAKRLKPFFQHWQRELEHTRDQTRAQYDLYHDLRRTNEELLSTKQNEVMRKLTLVAFITSPLTIMAGIFGMNTRNIPFIGLSYDFWLIIGVMVVIVIFTIAALKYKGWFE